MVMFFPENEKSADFNPASQVKKATSHVRSLGDYLIVFC